MSNGISSFLISSSLAPLPVPTSPKKVTFGPPELPPEPPVPPPRPSKMKQQQQQQQRPQSITSSSEVALEAPLKALPALPTQRKPSTSSFASEEPGSSSDATLTEEVGFIPGPPSHDEPKPLAPTCEDTFVEMLTEWDVYSSSSETGRLFYHNPTTGETSWKPPRRPPASSGTSEGVFTFKVDEPDGRPAAAEEDDDEDDEAAEEEEVDIDEAVRAHQRSSIVRDSIR